MRRPGEIDGETFYRALGSSVRDARVEAGLLQAEVAARVGLSRQSLVNVEAGRHHVSALTLVRLLDLLGLLLPFADPPAGADEYRRVSA